MVGSEVEVVSVLVWLVVEVIVLVDVSVLVSIVEISVDDGIIVSIVSVVAVDDASAEEDSTNVSDEYAVVVSKDWLIGGIIEEIK